MEHLTKWPKGLKKLPCRHKATRQSHGILKRSTNVETTSGTVAARPGDVLMLAVDGESIYPLSLKEFRESYDK